MNGLDDDHYIDRTEKLEIILPKSILHRIDQVRLAVNISEEQLKDTSEH